MAVVGIAGITGKFARRLATHLLKAPGITLRGYCRDPSKVPAFLSSSPKFELFQGGAFDDSSVRSFVRGCDVVTCCYLGDNKLMVDGQKVLIDACEEENVPRYIASDWTLDYTKLELGQLFPKDPMKHVKAYLETKENVKGVHVFIGGFMNTFFSPFFNVWDPAKITLQYWGEGDEIWEGTSYDNAAEYTAAVALDANANGVQRFLGGRATIHQIAESFEKAYGVKPQLERLGSQEELYKHMHELRTQSPREFFKYMPLFYKYYMISGKTFVGPELDNSKYPNIKPINWEDFMRSSTMQQLSGMQASAADV